mgnify:FL=1|jgi:TPR repeat protein
MRLLLLCLLLSLALPTQALPGADAAPLARAQVAIDKGRWQKAQSRLLPLARKGNPVAQWALARLLELPTPVRDLGQALHWYTQLAEQGAPAAMEAVGLAHYLGRGTAEDPAQAAQWFRRAGNAGEVASQFILATLYEKGEGVERDERLALAWYERAAAQGDVAAKAKLNAARTTPTAPP